MIAIAPAVLNLIGGRAVRRVMIESDRQPALVRVVRMAAVSAGTAVALVLLLISGAAPTQGREQVLDASGLPVPAWQNDSALAEKWRTLTGRYIFQRACISCHAWGPDRLSRAEWKSFLEAFPDAEHEGVEQEYADLTTQFSPGRKVPNRDQQTDALTTFLLAEKADTGSDEEPWDGFPRIGEAAPNFEIVDLSGRRHRLSDYVGKQPLVLVLSRAHW